MEKLINSEAGKVLARLVASGKAKIEDFDKTSPGYKAIEKSRFDSSDPADATNPSHKIPKYFGDGLTESYDTFPRPTVKYPKAPVYRNLCREWIEGHRKEWLEMSGQVLEKVEAFPDSKDLAA
tara:strand:- start:597 stop:965 length:369 start_codon:yes stop_codon:yes gene_type:complete